MSERKKQFFAFGFLVSAVALLAVTILSVSGVLAPEGSTPAPSPVTTWMDSVPQETIAPVTREPFTPEVTETEQEPSVYYRTCKEARAEGAAPLRRGDPGYRNGLDRDGDGKACDR